MLWLFLTAASLLSGDQCSSEPLEAGSSTGSGSDVSLRRLPALLHPLRADVRPRDQRSIPSENMLSPYKNGDSIAEFLVRVCVH